MSPESKWNQLWVPCWHATPSHGIPHQTQRFFINNYLIHSDGRFLKMEVRQQHSHLSVWRNIRWSKRPSHQNNNHQQTNQSMEVQSATDGDHQWHTMGTKSITLQLGFRFAKHDLDTKADRRQRHHNTTANTAIENQHPMEEGTTTSTRRNHVSQGVFEDITLDQQQKKRGEHHSHRFQMGPSKQRRRGYCGPRAVGI